MTAITTSVSPAVPANAAESSTIGPRFARGLWRIAAADASSGNEVELMRDGTRIFDAMIDVITKARETVVLESYLVVSDAVGERFSVALIAAAARGVKVRMIADWAGSRGAKRAYWRTLREGGVDVRIFNKPGFRRWLGLLPRDHRKALVADEKVCVTGGIGLSEVWSGFSVGKKKKAPWRDTAVLIRGPAAQDMARAFETMWKRANFEERRAARRHAVRRARNTNTTPEQATGVVVGIIEGEPWRLRVARALQIQSVSAERTIWIASAYFYPSSAEIEALCGAALDGVDVRVLVPSKYDHPWVRRLTRSVYKQLLRNGVRIWEWNGVMMHAKTSVIDGRWVRVGSTDFNPLGIAINYELDAVMESQKLGKEAEAMFLRDLEESTEIKSLGHAHAQN